MKQSITKEQWSELSEMTRVQFANRIYRNSALEDVPPTIGQMIEFLGDDWITRIGGMEIISQKTNNEFCDLLWEGVKYKLKK